jgi:hypothetical protein
MLEGEVEELIKKSFFPFKIFFYVSLAFSYKTAFFVSFCIAHKGLHRSSEKIKSMYSKIL